jgi:hypothetical protein
MGLRSGRVNSQGHKLRWCPAVGMVSVPKSHPDISVIVEQIPYPDYEASAASESQ